MMCRRSARLAKVSVRPLVFSILLATVLWFPAFAQNENETIGFSTTHVFDKGFLGDNIDILNGNLTFTIPIGPKYQVNRNLGYQLNLVYNSKIWEYQDTSGLATQTSLNGDGPFGLGFQMSLGRVYFDTDMLGHEQWYYVTPDGNRHGLGGSSSPVNSSDSSYFFVDSNRTNSNQIVITDRDGVRYTFSHKVTIDALPCCNTSGRELNVALGGYYITRIEDLTSGTFDVVAGKFPNWVEIDYDWDDETQTGYGYGQCIKYIRDSSGRVIEFHNAGNSGENKSLARTTSIDFPAFAGATDVDNEITSTYTFVVTPSTTEITVPPFGANPPDPEARKKRLASRLSKIVFPNSYEMEFTYDNGSELSERTLIHDQEVSSPAKVVYTSGHYEYYKQFFYSGDGKHQGGSFYTNTTGLSREITRKDLYREGDTSPIATWEYFRPPAATNQTNPAKVTLTVSSPEPLSNPLHNDTVYFFRNSVTPSDPEHFGAEPDDGAAPEWDDGLNYRTEYWEGSAESGGRLIRTEDTVYTHDYGLADHSVQKMNIRTEQTTMTYVDDSMKTKANTCLEWSLGYCATSMEYGFGMSVPRFTHRQYTGINLMSPPPGPDQQFHGGKYGLPEYEEVSDGSRVLSRTDYEYYPGDSESRAQVKKKIERANPDVTPELPLNPTARIGDVVTEYDYYPSSGNVYHKILSSPSGGNTYNIEYEYGSGGYLKSKTFSGLSPSWKSIDWERDGNTGLIMKSCQPHFGGDGICTSYHYDALGRIDSIEPPVDPVDPLNSEYGSTITYPSLKETRVRQWEKSLTEPMQECAPDDDCIEARYSYDEFGKLINTRKRDFAGKWVAQRTKYDAFSKVLSQSEWVNLDASDNPVDVNGNAFPSDGTVNLDSDSYPDSYPATTYKYEDPVGGGQDPFGRVSRITTADRKVTGTIYHGEDTSVTVKGVNGPDDVLFDTQTTYSKDVLGRLVQVSFPTGVRGDGTTLPLSASQANYEYDLNGNLVQVDLVSPSLEHQVRRFYYDGLGRLIREDNPENGTTLYGEWGYPGYDAIGNLLRKRDNANNVVQTTYDLAGRPRITSLQGGAVLTVNVYDQTGGSYGESAGKLTTISSYSDTAGSPIIQHYFYEELNGRLSSEQTSFPGWTTGTGLQTHYTYNLFGLRTEVKYPDEGNPDRSVRDLTTSYKNGFALGLSDSDEEGTAHVTGIQYNPAGGMWKSTAPGGASDETVPDVRNRPVQILMKGRLSSSQEVEDLFNSGAYVYDGAGNISKIGLNRYRYDEANRLIAALEHDNSQTITYSLGWSYDPFGNMTSNNYYYLNDLHTRTFTHQNNRILSMYDDGGFSFTYDTRGNLTKDGDNRQYSYDSRNRLIASSWYSTQETFLYDSAARRMEKVANGVTTYYIRDQQGQVLSEFRKLTSDPGPPAWDRDYLYVGGRLVGEAENDNPHAPTSFRVTSDPANHRVTLNWTQPADTDLSYYAVYRTENTDPPVTTRIVVFLGNPWFIDPNVSNGIRYDYYVTAVDTAAHESAPTGTLKVLLGDNLPPSPPPYAQAKAGDGYVKLSWGAGSDDTQVAGYEVYRDGIQLNGGSLVSSPLMDLGLSNGTAYGYAVYSVDTSQNRSLTAATITATPQTNAAPQPPTGLVARPGCGSNSSAIHLEWGKNPIDDLVEEYQVFRHAAGETFIWSEPLLRAPGGDPLATSFDDDLEEAGSPPFTYVVRAVDAVLHTSLPSNEATARLREGTFDASPVAYSGDRQVTVRWSLEENPTCESGGCQFTMYRKWNGESGCESYVRVGSIAFDEALTGMPKHYALTDYSAINSAAYDYALAVTHPDGTESFFSSSVVGYALEAIRDVRRCRVVADPEGDPCLVDTASTGDVIYRWNPPITASYQPASASIWDSPAGYLKGYHVYQFYPGGGACGAPSGEDDAKMTRVRDASFDYDLVTGKDCEYYAASDFHSCTGNPAMSEDWAMRCYVVTGVYKIFANGKWLTRESGWSTNYDPLNSDWTYRCPDMPRGSQWCEMPICATTDIPEAPTDVTAEPGPDSGQIRISWTRPALADLAGYYLYANDPFWFPGASRDTKSRALFLKDHPYLYLDPNATTITLNGMNPGLHYSFYLVSVDGSGRISEPSVTTYPSVAGLADGGGAAPKPTNLRVRLWTTNDAIRSQNDGANGIDPFYAVRLEWNTEYEVELEQEISGAWELIYAGFDFWSVPVPPEDMGTVLRFRVRAKRGPSDYSDYTEPVETVLLPHAPSPLSPPSNLDARFDGYQNVLHWCPNPVAEGVAEYRIYRSETAGGPYGDPLVTLPYLASEGVPNRTWADPGVGISPSEHRYYYVMVAVRQIEYQPEEVSVFSNENMAGHDGQLIIGTPYHQVDPDSPDLNYDQPDANYWQCDDDYVKNRPRFKDLNGLDVPEAQVTADVSAASVNLIPEATTGPREASPYRMVGTGEVTFHYVYYHLDHLGSPRIMTDSNGVKVQGQHFLPFGEEMPIEAGTNTRKFTGHERDAETGLDYMGARYYEAGLGRFLAVDPSQKGAIPLNPQSWNRYVYARNNPIGFLDPNGRDAVASTKNGVTTVTIPVHFTGSGATPAAVRAIVDKDNNLKVTGDSKIKLNVVATDKPVQGVLNTMDLSPGKDKNFAPEGEGTNYLGGDKAHIDTDNVLSNEAASHDVLHFAGIQDRYIDSVDKDGNRTSTPEPGYTDDNVMVTRSGNQIKPEQLQEAVDNPTTKKVPEKK